MVHGRPRLLTSQSRIHVFAITHRCIAYIQPEIRYIERECVCWALFSLRFALRVHSAAMVMEEEEEAEVQRKKKTSYIATTHHRIRNTMMTRQMRKKKVDII